LLHYAKRSGLKGFKLVGGLTSYRTWIWVACFCTSFKKTETKLSITWLRFHEEW